MYPVTYEADYRERRDRLRTAFRLILMVPWYLVQQIYSYVILVTACVAWVAIVVTSRYPLGLYDFNAGYLRFQARATGFMLLQTDAWPSFGFADDPAYPIRVNISPPLDRYSRLRTGFRFILAIPVIFLSTLMFFLLGVASIISWFVIVFAGRQPEGIHNALAFGNSYFTLSTAYATLLMTERFPPTSLQGIAPPPDATGHHLSPASASVPGSDRPAQPPSAPPPSGDIHPPSPPPPAADGS